jgi:hypothetical protein
VLIQRPSSFTTLTIRLTYFNHGFNPPALPLTTTVTFTSNHNHSYHLWPVAFPESQLSLTLGTSKWVFYRFLFSLTVAFSQRRHRVEVYCTSKWCKATFNRYDYEMLLAPKVRGRPREVRLRTISWAFLTGLRAAETILRRRACHFQQQWGAGGLRFASHMEVIQ